MQPESLLLLLLITFQTHCHSLCGMTRANKTWQCHLPLPQSTKCPKY